MPEPLMIRGRPPRSAALALLEEGGLPVSDLTDKHLEHFFFIGSGGSPMGLVGLEIYGAKSLLRSLVVGKSARTKGIGSALVQHAEEYAFALQVRAIYLLMTTAESFFERLGYRRVERAHAPTPIRSTREFETLCPESSAFMIKRLNTAGER